MSDDIRKKRNGKDDSPRITPNKTVIFPGNNQHVFDDQMTGDELRAGRSRRHAKKAEETVLKGNPTYFANKEKYDDGYRVETRRRIDSGNTANAEFFRENPALTGVKKSGNAGANAQKLFKQEPKSNKPVFYPKDAQRQTESISENRRTNKSVNSIDKKKTTSDKVNKTTFSQPPKQSDSPTLRLTPKNVFPNNENLKQSAGDGKLNAVFIASSKSGAENSDIRKISDARKSRTSIDAEYEYKSFSSINKKTAKPEKAKTNKSDFAATKEKTKSGKNVKLSTSTADKAFGERRMSQSRADEKRGNGFGYSVGKSREKKPAVQRTTEKRNARDYNYSEKQQHSHEEKSVKKTEQKSSSTHKKPNLIALVLDSIIFKLRIIRAKDKSENKDNSYLEQKVDVAKGLNIAVTVAIVAVATVVFGIAAVLGTRAVCTVKQIKITGNGSLAQSDILACANIRKGECMFDVDLNTVEAKISEWNPYICATVKKTWPRSIYVNITWREVYAAILCDGKYILIDKDAIALEVVSEEYFSGNTNVIRINGISTMGYKMSESILKDSTDAHVNDLVQLLDVLKKIKLSNRIVYIDLSASKMIYYKTTGGLTVKIGDISNLQKKLEKADYEASELAKDGMGKGVLDVSDINENPRYIKTTQEAEKSSQIPNSGEAAPTIPNSGEASNPT